ncbi:MULTISPECIES: hypothetical protein [Pseudomonadota]|uniref:hypothetical protein n=2 Tax=Pseudomonadota TaxID=1224 RepID=UPI0012E3CA77|nr:MULTISPECIES: hypothetical protein [Pseudomonadota]
MNQTAPFILPDTQPGSHAALLCHVAYPDHERLRMRALSAIKAWDRFNAHRPMGLKRERIEAALRQLDRRVSDRLVAGHVFARQVLKLQRNDGIFGNLFGTRAFHRRRAAYLGTDEANLIQRLWQPAYPVMHIAAAMGERLAVRPPIEHWLYSDVWLAPALASGERWRLLAIEVDHPRAMGLRPVRFG